MNNSIKPFLLRQSLVFFIIGSLVVLPVAGHNSQDKQAILKKSADAYYSLKRQGITGFECIGTPNWDRYVEENYQQGGPLAQTIIKKMKVAQVKVSMSEAGAPTADVFLTDGSETEDMVSDVLSPAAGAFSGFIQYWWPYAYDTPFEGIDSDADIKEEGSGYRIRQRQGSSDIVFVIDKDFVISEKDIQLQGGGGIQSKPKFTQTPKGLLLTSLESDIKSTQQHISISIEYQDVEGIKLPAKVYYKATAPNQILAVEMTFGKYKLTKG
jgi:hypothetical protein